VLPGFLKTHVRREPSGSPRPEAGSPMPAPSPATAYSQQTTQTAHHFCCSQLSWEQGLCWSSFQELRAPTTQAQRPHLSTKPPHNLLLFASCACSGSSTAASRRSQSRLRSLRCGAVRAQPSSARSQPCLGAATFTAPVAVSLQGCHSFLPPITPRTTPDGQQVTGFAP